MRIQVWKCGGGRQSTAIAALICLGRIPKPDYALIADTEREKEGTWVYLDAVLRPALEAAGVNIVRVPKSDYAKEGIYDLQGKTLLIPVFSNSGGETGKMSAFCSDKWKTRVADRWLRAHGVKQWRAWLGFSVDEPRRWARHIDSEDVWLPLVLGYRLRKEECAPFVVREMGWPEPPRSNCWMCPNQSDDEWRWLRDNSPAEFQKAVLFERELRERDPFAFLHRSCVPLDEVEFVDGDTAERACSSGECFV